jgi:hypothetical protein
MAPLVLQGLRPTNAAARHPGRTGPTSGRPLFPGVLRSRQSQAPGNAGEMLARGAPLGGDGRYQDRMNARVPQVGPDGSHHPTARLTGNWRLGRGCPIVVQQSVTSRNPIPSGPALARLGTRSHRAAPEASPFGSCGSGPADGSRPRVLPVHVRSRSRAGRGPALAQRPPAATAAHTADRAERPRAGQHPDGPTGSAAGRSLRTITVAPALTYGRQLKRRGRMNRPGISGGSDS